MAATTVVDLLPAVGTFPSIAPAAGVGSTPASGVIVGGICDMRDQHHATNLVIAAGPSTSGQFKVLVQTSDATTSGSFTDPTSGLQVMPGAFLSGGVFVVNSGNILSSGGLAGTYFMRGQRYVRGIVMSGDLHNAPVSVNFLGQHHRTGSGAGYSYSPASGSVSV